MKFICDREQLYESTGIVQKATATSTTMKTLECILIEAGENIKLTGNNLETGIDCEFPANIQVPGRIAVDARMFGEIVRRLPDGAVYVDVADNYVVNIKCGESNFDILGIPGDDFPELPSVKGGSTLNIPGSALLGLIRQTIFAVSQNESKPVLTGVKFEIGGGKVNAIAVDGYRLAFRTEDVDDGGVCTSCVIPGRALGELMKVIKNSDKPIEMCITPKHAMFRFDGCRFITRLLDGEFLNYKSILPKDGGITVKLKTQDLMRSLERAALLADDGDGGKSPVRLNLSPERLTVSCVTGRGKAVDSIPVQSLANNFEIGFNHRFLLDALRAAETDDIIMEFGGSINPAVIKPTEGEKFIFIVLPVRLRE